jgi:hypothetical protein
MRISTDQLVVSSDLRLNVKRGFRGGEKIISQNDRRYLIAMKYKMTLEKVLVVRLGSVIRSFGWS